MTQPASNADAVLRECLASRVTFERAETENDLGRPDPKPEPPLDSRPMAIRYEGLLGVSEQMQSLFAMLQQLESSLSTILIHGDSGTGKELVARALHARSKVASGPFVAVNCGSLQASLARSEMFGHQKGSFTGAINFQAGHFEAADGGTLFLDEIAELPSEVQPMLLRALESGSIVRLGETAERKVNVRLIAATHRDLKAEVDAGRFRLDLYYRLAVIRLAVPPLRERPEDIDLLTRHFAHELGVAHLPAEFCSELRGRPFPGNVRELRNTLEALAALGTFSAKPAVDRRSACNANDLRTALRESLDLTRPYARQKDAFLRLFQQVYLELLMSRTGGNQSEAARLSGLDRSHLNKMVGKLTGELL
jgi:two-component system, NtrC family, response regulator GlrR